MTTLRDVITSIDWILLGSAILLVLLGLAMLLSATYTQSEISPLFYKQSAAAGIGLAAVIAIARVHYQVWRRFAPLLFALGVGSLVFVTIAAPVIRGTVSRFEVLGVQIQPSEFMKAALVLTLAWLFAKYKHVGWKQVLISGVLAAVPVGLVALEPDVGTALLLAATWAGLLIFLGTPWRILATLALIAAVGAGVAWQSVLLDYQKERIVTFVNPAAAPEGAGYNVTQSIIALGSGQFLGRGLGHGPQSQLKFLPEQHTDFILASIGEELGFVGVVVVIALYVVIFTRLLRIAKTTEDRFARAVIMGVFFMLLASFAVSAGMNMGLLPVTGIPLPLVSYGGSSVAATFLLLGLVQSVKVHSAFVRSKPLEIEGIV